MSKCGPAGGLVIALTLCLIVVFMRSETESLKTLKSKGARVPPAPLPDRSVSLVVPPGEKKCDIWERAGKTGKPWHTESYIKNRSNFEMEFKRVLKYIRKSRRQMEGHSADLPELTRMYLSIVNTSSFIRTVCETGFNAGHSSLSWLTGNVHTHVYSFDLGGHPYSRPMASYLQATFPGRLTVTWGDSKVTIPAFIKQHPDVRCDLIIVDGGHDYREANADLSNFRRLASKVHLLLVDDISYPELPGVRKAWTQNVESEKVAEFFRCTTSHPWRSFVVGKYINLLS